MVDAVIQMSQISRWYVTSHPGISASRISAKFSSGLFSIIYIHYGVLYTDLLLHASSGLSHILPY